MTRKRRGAAASASGAPSCAPVPSCASTAPSCAQPPIGAKPPLFPGVPYSDQVEEGPIQQRLALSELVRFHDPREVGEWILCALSAGAVQSAYPEVAAVQKHALATLTPVGPAQRVLRRLLDAAWDIGSEAGLAHRGLPAPGRCLAPIPADLAPQPPLPGFPPIQP